MSHTVAFEPRPAALHELKARVVPAARCIKAPSVTITYDVSRVTVADIANRG
jgi:hypothetical protein